MNWSLKLPKSDLDRFHQINRLINRLTKRKEILRGELIEESVNSLNSHYLLRQKVVFVPKDFFDITGISQFEFILTRFPAWDLISQDQDEENIIYRLRRNPLYESWTKESDKIQINKGIQENEPLIDWITLERESPEIFDKISTLEINRVVDNKKLEKFLSENPEGFSLLERHLLSKKPTIRLTSSEKKDD